MQPGDPCLRWANPSPELAHFLIVPRMGDQDVTGLVTQASNYSQTRAVSENTTVCPVQLACNMSPTWRRQHMRLQVSWHCPNLAFHHVHFLAGRQLRVLWCSSLTDRPTLSVSSHHGRLGPSSAVAGSISRRRCSGTGPAFKRNGTEGKQKGGKMVLADQPKGHTQSVPLFRFVLKEEKIHAGPTVTLLHRPPLLTKRCALPSLTSDNQPASEKLALGCLGQLARQVPVREVAQLLLAPSLHAGSGPAFGEMVKAQTGKNTGPENFSVARYLAGKVPWSPVPIPAV
ncbi:hypothetical protein B0T10DRAFT_592423 [Thelonectria olida]|uniref:Uncharacterized protein n=1 Tax=Thelonectria olida TaxID=1576542 RepID=A0A9P9AT18_9HYPO|nr:hypothetical protein B0T10DRAFT_592423 [Thelonectria olida]